MSQTQMQFSNDVNSFTIMSSKELRELRDDPEEPEVYRHAAIERLKDLNGPDNKHCDFISVGHFDMTPSSKLVALVMESPDPAVIYAARRAVPYSACASLHRELIPLPAPRKGPEIHAKRGTGRYGDGSGSFLR